MKPVDWRQATASAGFYALVGPLVGSAALLLGGAAVLLIDAPSAESVGTALLAIPVVLFFGYIFGVLPALVTGLLAGLVRHRITRWRHVLLVALLGSGVTVLLLGVLLYSFDAGGTDKAGSNGLGDLKGFLLLAAPGFIASFYCAWRQLRANRAVQMPPV